MNKLLIDRIDDHIEFHEAIDNHKSDVAFLKEIKAQLLLSPYPSDFIPKGAELISGFDPAKEGTECTVKGFYKDGEFHIQEITWVKA